MATDQDQNEIRKVDDEVKEDVKSGWADSMAKILGSNKPKNKKTLILSRAKKDFEIRKKKVTSDLEPTSIQVVGLSTDDAGDSEAPAPSKKRKLDSEDTVISVKTQRKLEIEQRRKLRDWENINLVKPDPMSPSEKARERELVKIGTKGVVQLFNAVNLQQKALKDKLRDKKSEFKKEKVMNRTKDIFESSMEKSKRLGKGQSDSNVDIKEEEDNLHEPMTTGTITFKTTKPGKASKSIIKSSKKVKHSKPAWAALHDDYMIGSAKLKDWGKDAEERNE